MIVRSKNEIEFGEVLVRIKIQFDDGFCRQSRFNKHVVCIYR